LEKNCVLKWEEKGSTRCKINGFNRSGKWFTGEFWYLPVAQQLFGSQHKKLYNLYEGLKNKAGTFILTAE